MKKKRIIVSCPQDLIQGLKEISKKTGAPVSEIIRRASYRYLKDWKKDGKILPDTN
jgi:metal-responsive CopG/Arc/MetJ family transcriptional regulator